MKINISENIQDLGRKAGAAAAGFIRQAIESEEQANIILATGTSQFEVLNQLIKEPGIDWGKVVMFHLDEYIGLSQSSPASFRKYLQERFVARIPPLKAVHFINGETDPEEECERLGKLIARDPIHLALVGIGENGHLAFNDPPADFGILQPYIIVTLDEPCRKQQLGEGWFNSLEEVPRRAISMSIRQIMRSKHIICSVPDKRKALAVKNSLQGPVTNLYPASILQTHQDCYCWLDRDSAALI